MSKQPLRTKFIRKKYFLFFFQGEPNLVNEPIVISSDIFLSLPETLSLPSTHSATGQTPTTTFPTKFPNHLDDRYRELQGTSIPVRLDWNTV